MNIKGFKILIVKKRLSYQELQKNVGFNLVININNNNHSCYKTPTITSLDIHYNKQISVKLNDKDFLILLLKFKVF